MSFTEIIKGKLKYFTADSLNAASGVVHAFTTRHGGVSTGIHNSLNLGFNCGDDRENVMENYRIICDALNLDASNAVLSNQVHKDGIHLVTDDDKGKGIFLPKDYDADALVTNVPGIPLFIFTADCVPILLYDPIKKVIAGVHAGWKGTVADISGKTVRFMRSTFGCSSSDIIAAVGYSIGKCCFETDADVPQAVRALLGGDAEPFITQRGQKFHVDLKGINRHLLIKEGVPAENISVLQHCTMCMHETYWSHRFTHGERGSQASIISLLE